ncbi:hypothetical protein ScPMuIL_010873 [Solemya velum]
MEKAIVSFLCFGVLLAYCNSAYAICTAYMSKKNFNEYGVEQSVCDNGQGLRVLPGSKYMTSDCQECTCTNAVLECCKPDPRIDDVGLEDCDIIWSNCKEYIVSKKDNTKDCFTGEPVNLHIGDVWSTGVPQ